MDHHYDIAIIGLGCAGSHIVHELINQNVEKKIVVIDPWSDTKPGKAWSFWEKGAGKWDHLVKQTWSKTIVRKKGHELKLDLEPYVYKSLDSKKFTAFAKARLEQSPHITFLDSCVEDVSKQASKKQISLKNGEIVTADLIFDSRIPAGFSRDSKSIKILQHFKGIVIETNENHFVPDVCTMMDYTLMDEGTCSFTYVLPYSRRSALVEFTYFSHEVVTESTYDHFLKKYIKEHLKIEDYHVTNMEQGVVPMTTYDFKQHNQPGHFRIGTAGGWVKPSTGYSFKMSEKKAKQLVDNIKNDRELDHGLFSRKSQLYDATLLDVLDKNNGKGDEVFFKLYSSNQMKYFFRFLDEETTFLQDLRIMFPMTSLAFLKPFFSNLPKILWRR